MPLVRDIQEKNQFSIMNNKCYLKANWMYLIYIFTVQIREAALKLAEDELHKLRSRNDDKVDK